MPKIFTSKTQKTGKLGEDISVNFLILNDFKIIERNFTRFIGEIDIVATKNNVMHFIEVKSVSCETNCSNFHVKHSIRGEENFTKHKADKFRRIINLYLVEKNVSCETSISVDLIIVNVDRETKSAEIIPFWNIII